MRVKFSQAIFSSDGTPLAGGRAYVLRTGAVINEIQGIKAGSLEIDVYQPGALENGDLVMVWDGSECRGSTTNPVIGTLFTVDTLTDNGSDWTITFSAQSGSDVTTAVGDRLVLLQDVNGLLGHSIDLFKDDTSTREFSNPVTLGDDGMLAFWTNVTNVDLIITGDNVTSTYVCDLQAGGFDLKHNMTATAAPVATDDNTSGYSVGSQWFDVTNDAAYVCLDATTDNAVWTAITDDTDDTAIHRNVAAEINSISSEKTSPASNDWLVIEDSADSWNKKKVRISNLPAGGESNDLEDTCTGIAAGELLVGASADTGSYTKISTLSEEATPAAGDWLLGEESGGAVRKFDVGDLPYPVTSVFSRTGAVVAASNDYTWAQIDKTTSDVADLTTKSHTSLTDIGTTTHAQIDTHVGLSAGVHGVTGSLVGTSDTQTLTSKILTDASCFFADDGDASKRLAFQCSGITTGNTRTLTVPDSSGIIVTQTGSATLLNKVLSDATCYVADSGDTSKRLAFECSGITTSTTRTITVPDASGTMTLNGATQTLTNKTLTDATNKFRGSKSITIEDAVNGEDISIFFTNKAITITEMRCVMVGTTPSVTWTVRHGTDRSAAGAEVVTGGTTTTSTTTGSDVTSFNDATIVADSFVWLETTAQSGTVNEMHLTIFYTED